MESLKGEGQEDFGSLFEGMVLIDPSSQLPVQEEEEEEEEQQQQQQPPQRQQDPPLSTTSTSQQQPLDENLFSDLTLVNSLSPDSLPHTETPASATTTTSSDTPPSLPTRQTSSRKKKRAGIRIGYGRETPDPDPIPLPITRSSSYSASQIEVFDTDAGSPEKDSTLHESPNKEFNEQQTSLADSNSNLHSRMPVSHEKLDSSLIPVPDADSQLPTGVHHVIQSENECPEKFDEEDMVPREIALDGDIMKEKDKDSQEEGEDPSSLIENKLMAIREQISEKLERIRIMGSSVSAARKESVRRKRKAAENVNLASGKYRDLEQELEEACEAEDFESAEKVSEELAAVEKEKEAFLNSLREAEAECDSVDTKMQEILELQIAAEEEAASKLKHFAMDATESADLILKNAKEHSSKEMEDWLLSTEDLELKKMATDIELHLINEARSGLKDFIESSIEVDLKEKELLSEKQEILTDELDKLLLLVRLKESEIAENTLKIEEVDKNIAIVVSEFHNAQSSVDMKYDNLQRAFSEIKSNSEALSLKKNQVDEFMLGMEQKMLKLKELANASANEAKTSLELVDLRKSLAASVLKSREDKVRLAKTEDKISEDVQMLRQQVSAARASLQELSSTRASIQQEIVSAKQRISFIDKRGPELEAEKKVAAAARNFKEAGRIATEAKALGMEKEDLQIKMEKAISELEKAEAEIKDTVNKLEESERLISSKEKEAAMAGCERLRLVAAAAMAERAAALKLGDVEEAEVLLAEAEAADFEALKLQQAYGFEVEEIGKTAKQFISMALIANLAGKELDEIAASVQPTVV